MKFIACVEEKDKWRWSAIEGLGACACDGQAGVGLEGTEVGLRGDDVRGPEPTGLGLE